MNKLKEIFMPMESPLMILIAQVVLYVSSKPWIKENTLKKAQEYQYMFDFFFFFLFVSFLSISLDHLGSRLLTITEMVRIDRGL